MADGGTTPQLVEDFITHWSKAEASERANAQPFLIGLAKILGVPEPSNSHADGYTFEFPVKIPTGPDTSTDGRIDLYRRASFVLEAKQFAALKEEPTELALALDAMAGKRKAGPLRGSEAWDDAMWKARGQAERYARNLPADEPPAPFLLVVDVGHSIEVYADFTQAGRAYNHFPDPRNFRIRLADLRDEKVRARLRAIWLDPLSLDPAKVSAAVTREIAGYLALLAASLEKAGHAPKLTAEFLTRCLFCMFAEDVGLLPKDGFRKLLEGLLDSPEGFVPTLRQLFGEMQKGHDYSTLLRKKILRFNGGLFEDASVLPLDATQLGILIQASQMQWKDVEPAIFGTLLERALNPDERHKLGAHFTPRAYVERLVLPTVIEPLRAEWESVRAAAATHARRGDLKAARAEVNAFHDRLCSIIVLDPACGTANFLYVSLQHLKLLEGDVLDTAAQFGENFKLELETHTIDPHQFLGIELHPRAASIAELVLWIGYLQWHFKIHGERTPPEPVLRAFKNIECRDAVLAWDGDPQPARDERGEIITVWDRRSMKTDLVTGRDVPDETKRVALLTYPNARPADWKKADYIVGNPPFIGNKRMREDLGDGYAETLRAAYPAVPDSADFVMYWWHKAAVLVAAGKVRRLGLITTNSLRQTFNRRVVQQHLDKLSLVFAIPDHPWVDATAEDEKKAAVRISMTVAAAGAHSGELRTVTTEDPQEDGSALVTFAVQSGKIAADLTTGADVAGLPPMKANELLATRGVGVGSSGFIVTPTQAAALGLGTIADLDSRIRSYRNGKDITDQPRDVMVIDLFGLSAEEVRQRYPAVYQHVLTHVKPERDENADPKLRREWWLFRRSSEELRGALAGMRRFIATPATAKHRFFTFLDGSILPDDALVVIAIDDAFHIGVLSSRIHIAFALATGATLEDRPRYIQTRCFDPFPFPACDEAAKARIRALGEELDAHRKRVQAQHPGLSLTAMYNVLEKLRAAEPRRGGLQPPSEPQAQPESGANAPGRGTAVANRRSLALTAKEQAVHDAGLVSVLRQLHDELDAAVAAAYGWLRDGRPETDLPDAEILARLVALNATRAAEEATGTIRWLRPEYQAPAGATTQSALEMTTKGTKDTKAKTKASKAKTPWPKSLAERVRATELALQSSPSPVTPAELAKRFTRAKPEDLAEILETLAALGRAHQAGDKFTN